MTTKTIGIYSAPAAVRLPELASERQLGSSSSRPSWISVDYTSLQQQPPMAAPRRYEDTKQFVVQDCTHHRILKVGHDVHHRLTEEARSQQDEATRARESQVRQECQRATEKRLAELEKQLAMQHEFKVARLRQECDRVMQEKILETETAMRKDLIEAVEKEREEGKRRLKEKEDELTAWWTAEADRLVAEARKEERATAVRERQRLAQQHEKALAEARREEQRLRDEALKRLAEEKAAELRRELAKAREEERLAREALADRMQLELDQLATELAAREAELLAELEQSEAGHAATRGKRAEAEEELMRLYREFETFIDRVLRLNTNGEGAFLLPYTDFLRGVSDARDQQQQQQLMEQQPATAQQRPSSRKSSTGTVTLQRVRLPSNVRLVTDFT